MRKGDGIVRYFFIVYLPIKVYMSLYTFRKQHLSPQWNNTLYQRAFNDIIFDILELSFLWLNATHYLCIHFRLHLICVAPFNSLDCPGPYSTKQHPNVIYTKLITTIIIQCKLCVRWAHRRWLFDCEKMGIYRVKFYEYNLHIVRLLRATRLANSGSCYSQIWTIQ